MEEEKFNLVKEFIMEMDLSIVSEEADEHLVIVDDEDNGIKNLIIDVEDPILIIEQIIMKVPGNTEVLFKRLLQMNRNLVHGAFVLDEDCEYIIFRDTLQIENIDRNELEGSIQALSLALSEFGNELIEHSK
ncbi:MAG: YbjN domain-containing protein [Desulfobacterales bacterium]|nr:YbjN domain-containing protein [Desulfobacterales bacterium]